MTVQNTYKDSPRLKILGINSSEMRILRKNVELALQELALALPLEQVETLDQLLQYDISGIPALAVDGKVILQREVPSVHDLKILLQNLFLLDSTNKNTEL